MFVQTPLFAHGLVLHSFISEFSIETKFSKYSLIGTCIINPNHEIFVKHQNNVHVLGISILFFSKS